MTSLNLYDYSLAKNIEVGIVCNFAKKGLLGKVVTGTENIINQGVDKVGKDVFGITYDVDPVAKFELIFNDSTLMYKTEPIIVDAVGIKGFVGVKKLNGFNVTIDNLTQPTKETKFDRVITELNPKKEEKKPPTESYSDPSKKTKSASQLAKSLGTSQADITNLMQKNGLINNDKITPAGLEKGLVMKNYMGNDYIAYPDNLPELNVLRNKRPDA
jgi:hypothetical protein